MKRAQRQKINILPLWVFLAGILIVSQGPAAPLEGYWLCRRASEVRTLRLEATNSECLGWYTKEGLDEKVAESKDPQFCVEVLNKIKTTLREAGWKCRDISKSQISN